ncbi:hypothetical protein [Pseudogulbenkiania sp. NH8B]|uniref:hypothetical protein n=1 Tax=Pseudogulbenkiania sp. (strain NH8B) TaxID=748280 RepID=UPI0011D183DD|nr:hypothetical protein [Pseudogulbenkiania sp. NH8B]
MRLLYRQPHSLTAGLSRLFFLSIKRLGITGCFGVPASGSDAGSTLGQNEAGPILVPTGTARFLQGAMKQGKATDF